MTKVSFFTLGCRSNQAETAILKELFKRKGFQLVAPGSPADIVVINSCTVTAQGDREARKIINRCQGYNAQVRVAVVGCQAQVQKKEIFQWPHVCWVVGNAKKMLLADIVSDDLKASECLVVAPIRRVPFVMPHLTEFGSRVRVNLKIQDGCDNFCAYCEVPFARGRSRSRVFEDVVGAAEDAARQGHQEIVLTGINLGLYDHAGKSLLDVIGAIEKIREIKRIRVSSLEYSPGLVSLASLMQSSHKLCRFLHVPIQSGCDKILRRMGRQYSCHDVAALVRAFQKKVPGIMMGTDVIVGFPGETEKDFEQTYAFLEQQPFHYFHVFSYSDRQRARSCSFKGHVALPEIERRSRVLRMFSQRKRMAFINGLVGDVVPVLFEHKKEDHWVGHTDNYVTIKANSSMNLRNQIVLVKVVGIDVDAAKGEVL